MARSPVSIRIRSRSAGCTGTSSTSSGFSCSRCSISSGVTFMSNHVIVPVRTYCLLFLTLMVCTPITIAVAFVDLGPLNAVVAMTIAVLKATLVVLFFMHVKYSTRLTWAVVIGSVFWLGILLTLTLSDYTTRVWRTFG